VAFRWPGGGPYPAGVTFVKIIAGMAGDAVTRADREFFVNGMPVGQAKTTSRMGLPLEPGPTGILPAGRYYVQAPHPDSLDSRYRLTGWISDAQIIGRAYALF
jgi:conjugal transfer pilin signal peptidase TrbI